MSSNSQGAASSIQKKIISKATSTTTNVDGTRSIKTVIQYNDGTRSIATEVLPPRQVEPKPQPTEAAAITLASPQRQSVSEIQSNVPFDEESVRGLSYMSSPSKYTSAGPVSMIFVDDDEEDVSIMDSVFEHPAQRNELAFPAPKSTQQLPLYSAASPVSIAPEDSNHRDTVPTESPDSYVGAANSTGCDRKKWIVFSMLLLLVAGAGVAICVYIAFRTFNSGTPPAPELNIGRTMAPSESIRSSSILGTTKPTSRQSATPSTSPSASETTTRPSVVVSIEPSLMSSSNPSPQTASEIPSLIASLYPSPMLSQIPSITESGAPTFFPSPNPTSQPSLTPTSVLSITPSLASTFVSTSGSPSSLWPVATSSAPLNPETSEIPSTSPSSSGSVSTSPSSPTLSPAAPIVTQEPTVLTTTVAPVSSLPTAVPSAQLAPSSPTAPTTSVSSSTPVVPQASPAPSSGCKNTIGWVDRNNAGCDFYEANGCFLSSLKENNAGVTAWRACCTCGGGNQDFVDGDPNICQDYFGYVDNSGNTCQWYSQIGKCEEAALAFNAVGVSALEACCSCAGGSFSIR